METTAFDLNAYRMGLEERARPVALPSGEIRPIPYLRGSADYGVIEAGDIVLLHASPASGGGLRLARVASQRKTEGGHIYTPAIETLDGEPSGFNDYCEVIVGFFRGGRE